MKNKATLHDTIVLLSIESIFYSKSVSVLLFPVSTKSEVLLKQIQEMNNFLHLHTWYSTQGTQD